MSTFPQSALSTITTDTWPLIYRDVLQVGTPTAPIAICTLWTHRKSIARGLTPDRYAVIGNLYSAEGVVPIIRNTYANPHIRYLIVWGNELSGSGDALVEFWTAGVDQAGSTPSGRVRVEPEIGADAANRLRSLVQLIDLRGQPIERLHQVVTELPALPPFGEPVIFPAGAPPSESDYPEASASEGSGFRVSAPTVGETWLALLNTIRRFGVIKRTKYGSTNELREILNLTAVITAEDPDQVQLPDYLTDSLKLTEARLAAYYPQVLTAAHPEGTSYSYGQRLRDYDGIDQIAVMIDRLKQNPNSKRLFATTWHVAIDLPDSAEDVPCLTQINVTVQHDRLYLTAHFRSQDMFGAWPLNAFAILQMQALLAREAAIALGPLTIITHSAHVYAWDWPQVRDLYPAYQRVKRPAAEQDPRGYVVITAGDGQIDARLYDYTDQVVDRLSGNSARQVGLEIVRRAWTADAGHALYLGGELEKAELALRAGIPYVQDAALSLP